MFLLAIKQFIPAEGHIFFEHPIGTWSMYSKVTSHQKYSAYLETLDNEREDITQKTLHYLNHTYSDGSFIHFAHYSRFPKHYFKEFAKFLADQPFIKENTSLTKPTKLYLEFSCLINYKPFLYTTSVNV